MRIRAIAGLSLSALMLGGTMVGCAQDGAGIASASSRDEAAMAKRAVASAEKARKALAKEQAAQAVPFAETAVAMQPRDAGYRALLAQSYLKAGRFASAEAAYGDVLTLTPDDSRAALNLALAQIAGGHWEAARKTLDAHEARIDPTDLGLALALAGNPARGVDVLIAATRSPTASAKTRQNLALAFALAGRWQEARNMAGLDLAPADADQRIMQWAAFAKPNQAADQVAALLGVTPVADPGQPVALALNASVPVAVANNDAGAAVMAAPEPKPKTVAIAAASPAPVVETAAPPAVAKITFAPRREFVQALPAVAFTPANIGKAPINETVRRPAASSLPRVREKGDWYVQIGAYDSADVARDAWARARQRFAGFSGTAPAGMTFKTASREYYRLSVGGFSRADADATCRAYRAKGGTCFVRAGAGDQIAQWAKGGVQVAAR
ncbi:SPOR domain-containing protein [Sphingomonas sp. CL5.1]|uniref:SPOR domain-containing protein n=1 Tax=Sphingomonas sp. CL5.1 TaxID=2653203 RepID=UPI0015816127|nr:SPOR domain-containing protein [Sphingomonas sp. CL5.1]QKS00112.1 SPOR domain-containing protein [Sphingomonas sp. CL5.1]